MRGCHPQRGAPPWRPTLAPHPQGMRIYAFFSLAKPTQTPRAWFIMPIRRGIGAPPQTNPPAQGEENE